MNAETYEAVSSIKGVICPWCKAFSGPSNLPERAVITCINCLKQLEVTTMVSPMGFAWSAWRYPPGAPRPFLPTNGGSPCGECG